MIISLLLTLLIQIQSPKILFIGDSMTSYKGGWHHQLAKKLNVKYDNYSIPGKRTDWMEKTLTLALSKNKNYKKCYIYGGINDAFSRVKLESVFNNLQKIIDTCNKYNIQPIIVVGYNPKNVMCHLPIRNEKFFVNRYIEVQKLMLNLKNCKIVPIDESITRNDTDDGIHFTYSGHKKFSEWVYQNTK